MRAPKTAKLTAERAREVLEYDPDTGMFTWKIARPGCVAGAVAGTINGDGYVQIEIDFVLHKAHRLAWLIVTGEWPKGQIDHINRVRTDNRWCNLRDATPLDNSRNRTPNAGSKSGVVGVTAAGKKWSAYIGVDNRTIRLGRFDDLADAVAARMSAERIHFGEFAPSIVPDLEDLGGSE